MPHDLQIDLDIVLPEAHGLHDRCVEELLAVLDATDGIGDAHIHPATGESPAQLCLSVERGGLSLARLNDRARSAGAQISKRYGHVLWQLQGITHSTRARNASAEIRRLPGVLDAEVATGGAARIEFDRLLTNEKDLAEAVEDAGLALDLVTVARAHARQRDSGDHGREVGRHDLGSHDISQHDHNQGDHNQDGHDHDGHDHDERDGHDHGDGRSHSHDHAGHSHNSNVELAVSAVAFVVFMVARILDWVTDLDLPVTLAYVATATVTGFMVGRDVLSTLMARRFDIEMLMLAAAAGAAALGDWSDAALLLVLFSLGHGLEGFAMSRARREIESLGELAPTTAHLLDRDGSILEVAVADVRVGDILVVRPNDRISADGIVVKGTTTVDESPVTGESTPADKAPAPEFRDSDPTESEPQHSSPRQHRFLRDAQRSERDRGSSGKDRRGFDPSPGCEDGCRSRDPGLPHPAAHTAHRPDLRAVGAGTGHVVVGRPAALRCRIPPNVPTSHGSARRVESLRPRNRDAKRRAGWHRKIRVAMVCS
ncbi:MAG: hypothetical protein V9F03_00880 [Microthrixaceae bacterium]